MLSKLMLELATLLLSIWLNGEKRLPPTSLL
jgi:hypothetical protein